MTDNINLTFDISANEKIHGLYFALHPKVKQVSGDNTIANVDSAAKFYGAPSVWAHEIMPDI